MIVYSTLQFLLIVTWARFQNQLDRSTQHYVPDYRHVLVGLISVITEKCVNLHTLHTLQCSSLLVQGTL